MDEERKGIRDDAKQEVRSSRRKREVDKEKLITDLRSQIDDLKRMSEQGSPQARGEVMELVLENFLRDAFPHDTIEPVPVSYHGGDVLQHVHDSNGLDCGTILWESKRTKCWSDALPPKLRDDQRCCQGSCRGTWPTTEMPPKGLVAVRLHRQRVGHQIASFPVGPSVRRLRQSA